MKAKELTLGSCVYYADKGGVKKIKITGLISRDGIIEIYCQKKNGDQLVLTAQCDSIVAVKNDKNYCLNFIDAQLEFMDIRDTAIIEAQREMEEAKTRYEQMIEFYEQKKGENLCAEE